MAHRSGSTINSPLFMIDPISNNNTTSSLNTINPDQAFIVKGDESSSDLHLSSSSSDTLIFDNDGKSFQVSRTALRETLDELKLQANVSVRSLSPVHTQLFKSTVEVLRLLHGTQALYDIILSDIRGAFVDVTDVKPGTVAAFFIGCFNDDKFPGPMGCSPKCAASLPPVEGTPGYSNCEDLVLVYSDGLFTRLNERRSSHAYIYIDDGSKFSGFTKEDIEQLRSADIDNVSLIYGNPDGSYREVTSPLPLEQLPSNSPQNITPQSTQSTDSSTSSSNTTGAVIFIILLAIIILLLLYVVYRK